MTKTQIVPLSKEEMDRLMFEIEKSDDFDYMLFLTLKTTGRRIGELYGVEQKKFTGRKTIGHRTIYIDGKAMTIDRTIPQYKKLNNWLYGVKVKDVDLDRGIMKVWVLKRRQLVQDETILTPEVARIIRSYINRHRLKLEDHLFRRKGRGMRAIQKVIKRYAKKAKIDHPVTIHNFRHYFITELKRKGWTNDMIVKLTGHKTTKTLSIYDHIVAYDIREKALEDIKEL